MSSGSNGSTKQFISDTPDGPQHTYPRIFPPEIRLYPSLLPPPEASRYEPNFMLGYGGGLSYPRKDEKGGRKQESRFMSRPKAYDKSMLDPRLFLYPPTPELPRGPNYGGEDAESWGRAKGSWGSRGGSWGVKKGEGFDWHIPRASLACQHRGLEGPCDDCIWKYQQQQHQNNQLFNASTELPGTHTSSTTAAHHHHPKHHHHLELPPLHPQHHNADGASICSSVNPPPTFTALDNYRPVRPQRTAKSCRHCSCGIIFAITTVFSLLVLVLIAGFIIYVEMVLKHQTEKAMHRM
ncbi:uncharacterized protein LOC126987190 isoform X2 [Eriocheir sinensis]|nr:uncharacterized protein LOC126987190 isoform X2 [Eriocheir sinensis]XP_050699957.1 uncharacterized protein LOC126987190 isoform X2 [Eriocheir sinensis]